MAAFASVRAGYLEMIAGEFHSPGTENILAKIGADFGSAQNTQLLDGFFASIELLALAGVDSLVLNGHKTD